MSHLKRHIVAVHDGKKDHQCDSCGKAFSQAGDLKQHIHGVHEINKGHQCDSCGNSFSTKRTLKNHYITIYSQIDPDLNQNIDLKSEKPDENKEIRDKLVSGKVHHSPLQKS